MQGLREDWLTNPKYYHVWFWETDTELKSMVFRKLEKAVAFVEDHDYERYVIYMSRSRSEYINDNESIVQFGNYDLFELIWNGEVDVSKYKPLHPVNFKGVRMRRLLKKISTEIIEENIPSFKFCVEKIQYTYGLVYDASFQFVMEYLKDHHRRKEAAQDITEAVSIPQMDARGIFGVYYLEDANENPLQTVTRDKKHYYSMLNYGIDVRLAGKKKINYLKDALEYVEENNLEEYSIHDYSYGSAHNEKNVIYFGNSRLYFLRMLRDPSSLDRYRPLHTETFPERFLEKYNTMVDRKINALPQKTRKAVIDLIVYTLPNSLGMTNNQGFQLAYRFIKENYTRLAKMKLG